MKISILLLWTHHESYLTSINVDVKPTISNEDMANVATEMSRIILPQSEELDHKECAILMSAKDDYIDNTAVL